MDGRGSGGGGRGGHRGRGRGGRGFRGGGRRGGSRGGGRGRGRGGGHWRGGGGRGGRGRFGGGNDYSDRKAAEPTPEALSLMGTSATEKTVGITQFVSKSTDGFSGILKQRYSDFIVKEVSRYGEVSTSDDFPNLLRPIWMTHPDKSNTANNDGSSAASDAANGDGDREEVDEEQEDFTATIKAGASTLLPVLGKEVTAKVEAFVLEGIKMNSKDKRTLTLPSATKKTRTQVYHLLASLSKFILAMTVDEPSQGTPTPSTGNTATPKAKEDPDAQEQPRAEGETAASKEEEGGDSKGSTATSTNGTATDTKVPGEGSSASGAAPGAAPGGASEGENKASEGAAVEGSVEPVSQLPALTPHGPKCVQIKMKPDWRKFSTKRRRGDLSGRSRFKAEWPKDRPEYCRFVLYKENIDTMAAVNRVCRHLKLSPKWLGYAGNKDKRAVTSQWCTAKHKSAEEIMRFNQPLHTFNGPILLVGNFSYVSEPLNLGDLSGNNFGIVLRNLTLPTPASAAADSSNGHSTIAEHGASCTKDSTKADSTNDEQAATGTSDAPKVDSSNGDQAATGSENGAGATQNESKSDAPQKTEEEIEEEGRRLKEMIDERCSFVQKFGFINYFGLQRFGTGGAPTSEVGIAMLKEDWKGAVKLIMTPRIGENKATHDSKVHYLKNPADTETTSKMLPYFMTAERNMMHALAREGENAHLQALRTVPKNLQLMYLHAFQSLVWNLAASERVTLYGREAAVVGDLVFPKDSPVDIDSTAVEPEPEAVDENDATQASTGASVDGAEAEAEAKPAEVEEGEGEDEVEEGRDAKRARKCRDALLDVHVVTQEDVEKETFKVTDVILPLPGCGVKYPENGVRDCYMRALSERGLTEACFSSSSEKAFILGGAYRRMLQVPKDMKWEIKRYSDHTQHLIKTDIDTALSIDEDRRAKEQAEKAVATATADAAAPVAPAPAASEAGKESAAEPAASETNEAEAGKDPPSTEPAAAPMDVEETQTPGPVNPFHALCVHFTLPTASYATMCLREITRQDTSTIFHTRLNSLPAGQHPVQAAAGTSESAEASKGAVIKAGSSLNS